MTFFLCFFSLQLLPTMYFFHTTTNKNSHNHSSTTCGPKVGGRIRTLPLVMCQEPVWVPKVIQTSDPDLKVAPAVEEMVRLEGHYWAKSWAKGRKLIELDLPWGFPEDFWRFVFHLYTFHLYFVHMTYLQIRFNYAHTCFSCISFCQSNSNYPSKPEPTHWTCIWKLCWPSA